ncbi:twin-arginine translocation signal domain-containing protein [Natronomonas sp. EA1]|uniref:twin-arginine translocation signal domain-containing protein n=1 Tax=Natronomonas sp. EA1 TaxID=3421655 RepID=UPI003EBA4156
MVNRRDVLKLTAATGLAGALAGCSAQEPTGTPEPPTRTPLPPAEDIAPTVGIRTHQRYGAILVGPNGMSLYMFTPDEGTESVCYGGCAEAWPPLLVESPQHVVRGAGVRATLGTTTRTDGTIQVTANGMPLYYWFRDERPGDVDGQEVGNVWFLLNGAGQPIMPTVSTRDIEGLGPTLVDPHGMTLYMFVPDEPHESTCYGGCAEAWPPLLVDASQRHAVTAGRNVTAELDATQRTDGTWQVTANGMPLYYWFRDESRGDATGQGVNDAWFVLDPDGTVDRSAPPATEETENE